MDKDYILITGGAGYIGSVVAELLEHNNSNIIVVDDLRDGKRDALPQASVFFEENFGNKKVLREIFSNFKVKSVIHLAALANVPDSVINPLNYYENNLINTFHLLEIMMEFDINEIVFSSTAAVYGEPIYNPIDEIHPINPINPYGWSKFMVEQIIKDFAAAYGLKYIIFRYFCAAGATSKNGESRSYETHLIPVVLDTVLGRRERVFIFGNKFNTIDGTGIRDYIHVEDIANAHLLAIEKIDFLHNKTFNLGSGVSYSVLQILNNVEEHLNVKIPYEIVEKRPGDPAILVASYQKAKNELGWTPQKSIKDIIQSAFNWRKNPCY